MRRSTLLSQLPISPSDFVVEIGAGPTPFRYTKLIIDKYPFENVERHGDILNVAPVIKADAIKIPLADKACDVLFMSHVLEHLDEPEKFIEEAKRCARFVYLEFPSLSRELMYAWSFHKWLIEVEGGRLVFYKNDVPQVFKEFFHSQYDFLLDLWSEERFEQLNNYLHINTDDLEYTISPSTAWEYILQRSPIGDHKVNFENEYGRNGTSAVAYPLAARLKMLIWAATPPQLIRARNRISQKRNKSKHHGITNVIVARFLCQKCRSGPLRLEPGASSDEIVCNSCGERYVASNGIFDFDI